LKPLTTVAEVIHASQPFFNALKERDDIVNLIAELEEKLAAWKSKLGIMDVRVLQEFGNLRSLPLTDGTEKEPIQVVDLSAPETWHWVNPPEVEAQKQVTVPVPVVDKTTGATLMGHARVAEDIAPETMEALSTMVQCAYDAASAGTLTSDGVPAKPTEKPTLPVIEYSNNSTDGKDGTWHPVEPSPTPENVTITPVPWPNNVTLTVTPSTEPAEKVCRSCGKPGRALCYGCVSKANRNPDTSEREDLAGFNVTLLRNELVKARVGITEFCESLGISGNTIKGWEAGKKPDRVTTAKIKEQFPGAFLGDIITTPEPLKRTKNKYVEGKVCQYCGKEGRTTCYSCMRTKGKNAAPAEPTADEEIEALYNAVYPEPVEAPAVVETPAVEPLLPPPYTFKELFGAIPMHGWGEDEEAVKAALVMGVEAFRGAAFKVVKCPTFGFIPESMNYLPTPPIVSVCKATKGRGGWTIVMVGGYK
jgi:hypothetical protein